MGVAQLVERWIVAPVAVGSIPIAHPSLLEHVSRGLFARDYISNFYRDNAKFTVTGVVTGLACGG